MDRLIMMGLIFLLVYFIEAIRVNLRLQTVGLVGQDVGHGFGLEFSTLLQTHFSDKTVLRGLFGGGLDPFDLVVWPVCKASSSLSASCINSWIRY